jgi:hypothetical protein
VAALVLPFATKEKQNIFIFFVAENDIFSKEST